MKKKITHGKGYLSRVSYDIDLDNLDEIPNNQLSFIDRIKLISAELDNQLKLRHLPVAHQPIVLTHGDKWVYQSEKTIEEWALWKKENNGTTSQFGHKYIQDRVELYSEDWVLAELSFNYFVALTSIESSKVGNSIELFYKLGSLHSKYIENLRHGEDFVKHQNLKNNQQKADSQRICSLMEEYYPEVENFNQAAKLVLLRNNDLGGTVGSITRLYRRYRNESHKHNK